MRRTWRDKLIAGAAVTALAGGVQVAGAWQTQKGTYAVFDTTKGKIVCRLTPEASPKTVENFTGLAEGKKPFTDPKTGQQVTRPFYDGLVFHRVIPKFMIQGGDPLGSGMGGPGYKFADEITPDLNFNKPGVLAMANSGPNTNGSQFFITVDATPFLNDRPGSHYTIFGKVVEGQEVADAISTVSRDGNDQPDIPVVMNKVTIQRVK
jgi:peptidyl-prolyl cis-trans isomerase A (cyclophilin A)